MGDDAGTRHANLGLRARSPSESDALGRLAADNSTRTHRSPPLSRIPSLYLRNHLINYSYLSRCHTALTIALFTMLVYFEYDLWCCMAVYLYRQKGVSWHANPNIRAFLSSTRADGALGKKYEYEMIGCRLLAHPRATRDKATNQSRADSVSTDIYAFNPDTTSSPLRQRRHVVNRNSRSKSYRGCRTGQKEKKISRLE